MERWIRHVKNCIAEVLNFLFYMMVEVTLFLAFMEEEPDMWRMIGLVGIPLFYYFVRCRVHRFIFFFILHIIPPVILIYGLQGPLSVKVILILAAILQTVVSVTIRIKRGATAYVERIPGEAVVNPVDWGMQAAWPSLMIGAGVILYLVSDMRGAVSACVILMQIIIYYLFLYFFYLFMGNFVHYMEMSKRTIGNIPDKAIFTTELIIVGGFGGLSGLIIISFVDERLARVFGFRILSWIRALLTFLFSLIHFEENIYDTEDLAESVVETAPGLDQELPEESVFSIIIDKIFTVTSFIIVFLLLAAVIYGIVMLLRYAFSYKEKEKKEAGDDGLEDIIEKLEGRKVKNATGRSSVLFRTPEEKIRKLFYKTVWKRYKLKPDTINGQLLQYGTARECLSAWEEEKKEEADAFAVIYERARYGHGKCTEEDVKEAKRLTRLLQSNTKAN